MNEVSVKQSAALSTDVLSEWGAPTMSAQDIIIPKILPMQGSSDLVKDRKAMVGEFRDSVNAALIGDIDKPFHAIPFFLDKTWDILHQGVDGKFKFHHSVAVVENPQSPDYNDNWAWDAVVEGIPVKNVRRFNFYLLLPSEVESGASVPYIFSFKSTSAKEGKKLATQMYMRNIKAGLPPAAYTIKIGGKVRSNDDGSWIVPNYVVDRLATKEELNECLSWIKMIKGGAVKIDSTPEDSADLMGGTSEGTGDF